MVLELYEYQHVTFLWIPGHCGIAGNERADILAKEGAQLPNAVREPLAPGDVVHLKVKFREYLQRKWNDTHAGHMYRIKPRLQAWSTCNQQNRKREVILARLRCGHTRLTHGHLLDRSQPPIRQACDIRLSVEHILIGCSALRHERRHIINHLTLNQQQNRLETLLGNDDPILTDLVLDFILQSPASDKL